MKVHLCSQRSCELWYYGTYHQVPVVAGYLNSEIKHLKDISAYYDGSDLSVIFVNLTKVEPFAATIHLFQVTCHVRDIGCVARHLQEAPGPGFLPHLDERKKRHGFD